MIDYFARDLQRLIAYPHMVRSLIWPKEGLKQEKMARRVEMVETLKILSLRSDGVM